MQCRQIVNPKTGRQVMVKVWRVNPSAIMEQMKAGTIKSAKDVSWMLLNDAESIQEMEDTQYGDAASNNFALSVFENALDWSLGIAVLQAMRTYQKQYRCLPGPFSVAATRSGKVFLITDDGTAYAAS